jgi:pimeloyl-ACP methyl ester carboxylesterase
VTRDGFVPFRGHETWYRVYGDLDWPQTPLLCLHGGPGGASDLFEPLGELASTGRPVVVYDQLGSGRSDRPIDPLLWTIGTFVEELATVREQLGLEKVHLLGHSWGGMLALEYLFTKPSGVSSLILASSLSSTKLWCSEASCLRDEMPAHLADAMRRCEAAHTPKEIRAGDPKRRLADETIRKRARSMARVFPLLASDVVGRVAAAMSHVPPLRSVANELLGAQFGARHGSRARPVPLPLVQMFAGMSRDLYQYMWGPSEFQASGTLVDWDVTSRLGEIEVPTLLLSGRYDESTPKQNEIMRDGITKAEWHIFENSAHCAVVEEPEAFRAEVDMFIARHEA